MKKNNMKRFKTIDDLILPGEVRILDPEVERKIIEELEELNRIRLINEFNAIQEAKKILIL
jgi:hypothetical protein